MSIVLGRAQMMAIGAFVLIVVAALVVLKVRKWHNAHKIDPVVAAAVSAVVHAAVFLVVFSVAFTPAQLKGGGAGLGTQVEDSASRDSGSNGVEVALADPAEAGADNPALEQSPLKLPDPALLEAKPAVTDVVIVPKRPDLLQPEDPYANAPLAERLSGVVPDIPASTVRNVGAASEAANGTAADGSAPRQGGRGEGGASASNGGSGREARGAGVANDSGGGGGGEAGSNSGVVKPSYPMESRKNGEEGRVVVSVTIHADGTLSDIKVVESSGYSRLDDAAVEAIKHSTFTPATRLGVPVDSAKKIAFIFRLNE